MSVRDILMAAAGGTAGAVNYIDDVFSTYLYTGNDSTQTITNGIDLSTKGGLVWIKSRVDGQSHELADTVRGNTKWLRTNSTESERTSSSGNDLTSFNSNGFSLGPVVAAGVNSSGSAYASWTFAKQAKFFDIVTYTGNGVAGKTISHSLGSKPGCIIIKCIDDVTNWPVYNQALGANAFGYLSSDAAWNLSSSAMWNNTEPTATQFTVGSNGNVNTSGKTYVAYLFAHNAGGFGTAGTDNVISCGSYTGNGSSTGPVINLGYEPQWVLIKRTDSTGDWFLLDNMRGMPVGGSDPILYPNSAFAENNSGLNIIDPTATGFQLGSTNAATNASGGTYIYIAIRRPNKPPTTGTQVYNATTRGNYSAGYAFESNFPVDLAIFTSRSGVTFHQVQDRLRGGAAELLTTTTAAETTGGNAANFSFNNGYFASPSVNTDQLSWMFRRAPGFFDEVCYTGTGSVTNQPHNLTVAPEMIIVKSRSGTTSWTTYHSALGATKAVFLNATNAPVTSGVYWANTTPTSSVFTVSSTNVNISGITYVAYLFATVAGVSKVGSYTGNGTSQTINCGFTNGARFFLVKRTDDSGDWWVYDSARGIVSAADPALRLNSTAAEVTSADAVDPTSSGIIVNQESTCNINVSSASYIYLAIA